jgi:hypothetical protein
MNELYGPCASCGRAVKGREKFMGPIEYHCNTPPCWPEALCEWDRQFDKIIEKIINDTPA